MPGGSYKSHHQGETKHRLSIWWAADPSQIQTRTHSKFSIIQAMHQSCLHKESSLVFTCTHWAVLRNAREVFDI